MPADVTDPANLVCGPYGRGQYIYYGWRCDQCPEAGTGGYDTAEDAEDGAAGHLRNIHPYALDETR